MDHDLEVLVIDPRRIEEVGRGVGVLRDMIRLFGKKCVNLCLLGKMRECPLMDMAIIGMSGRLLVEF